MKALVYHGPGSKSWEDVPDAAVVTFVTTLIDCLHAAGLRVAADCDFTASLPPPDHR